MAKINYLLTVSTLVWGAMTASAQSAEINTNIARMQAMDKITGMVRVIDVPVNSEVKYGSFSIVVRACKTRPPEETPENFAFVDVVDNYKSENPINIFRGWMISSSPSLNPVEHPIYDIWLLSCENDKIDPRLKIMSDEELKAREQIPQREKTVSNDTEVVLDTDREDVSVNVSDKKSNENNLNEEEPKKVGEPLEFEAVKNEVEEKSVDAPTQTAPVVPSPVENDSSKEGPKSLINIDEQINVPEPKEQVLTETLPVEEVKVEENKSDVDAMVVITAPEPVIDTQPASMEPLILQEEPAPAQIDEVLLEDTINTDEVEENGMLDEQLIDFSE